ncbi:hypothetical protein MPTK1_7g07070 [Marchantia polymorpha subsp. ruderalis]|uniref:Uncharacterized protein n=2 Tax=Marchantia polymorpha TaxID=3197 RepID=A0A176VN70_MARPO|nr:hypothetical protein AXG93_1504s1410 [Marchantia polymorpha subsp. ruderalis]PTQ34855.1 hypothetical protein MARPO_0076s0087 [Marchantia polymorpha]BBN16523.1 hypothetical protein Mp_7g07070 [Marchantia polymorpha subsp. ruderalis]|eukprot:PTQ34855.1 hypothetical protein MARPO_0076s0087 [Marchantia polymorpha]
MASWAQALVIGLFVLVSGHVFQQCEAASLAKYRESYIVKFQPATCDGPGGKLILMGPKAPIALYGAGNFQVFTKAVSAGQKVPLDMWNQTLLRGPAVYQIEQSGNTDACMDVDPDSEAGSGLAQDVCVNQFTQRQEFEYKVVPKMVPGCKKDNRNAVAVTIKSLANPPSNLCLSAPKMPGARATTAICNERDDNQLFFINVPSIRRR